MHLFLVALLLLIIFIVSNLPVSGKCDERQAWQWTVRCALWAHNQWSRRWSCLALCSRSCQSIILVHLSSLWQGFIYHYCLSFSSGWFGKSGALFPPDMVTTPHDMVTMVFLQDDTRVCVDCEPGQYQDLPGESTCSPCQPGTRREDVFQTVFRPFAL